MRPDFSIHAHARVRASMPPVERLLEWIGADTPMIDALLGDLAEERAERASRHGSLRAHMWYGAECVRSAPWIFASAVRYGGAMGRRRVASVLAVVALAVTSVTAVLLGMAGDPALLTVVGDSGDGVVVNNVSPVQLAMHVMDARGHVLPDSGVRYHRIGGAPIPVSSLGVAKCVRDGDAQVRATLGTLSADLLLRCRPVAALYGRWELPLIIGDAPVPIPFRAVDSSGVLVSPLRGAITVKDTSIATTRKAADGQLLIRGLRVGGTRVEVNVGDVNSGTFASVFRRADSPTGVRPGDQVAVRVHLQRHELRAWTLSPSPEIYTIRMIPDGDVEMPYLAIVSANCVQSGEHGFMCAAPHGGTVYAYFPEWDVKSQVRQGNVAVERRASP